MKQLTKEGAKELSALGAIIAKSNHPDMSGSHVLDARDLSKRVVDAANAYREDRRNLIEFISELLVKFEESQEYKNGISISDLFTYQVMKTEWFQS